MKVKLREYIDTIFADAERRTPGNRRLAELKEEMLQNLTEKYDDLIAAGKSPAAAYNIAVAGVGDVTALLDSVSRAEPAGASAKEAPRAEPKPEPTSLTPEQQSILQTYRSRSAVLTSVAVALYILCIVPAMIFYGILGPVLMFVMIAVATALLIFNGMTKPKFNANVRWEEDDDDDDDDDDGDRRRPADDRPRRSPVYGAISGALWILAICAYLIVSFLTHFWQITWMIFLITVAIDNIIKAIFDIRR